MHKFTLPSSHVFCNSLKIITSYILCFSFEFKVIRRRNPSVVEFNSDDDFQEIHEETPARSRSKRGRGPRQIVGAC
jgi:hypothetical protein